MVGLAFFEDGLLCGGRLPLLLVYGAALRLLLGCLPAHGFRGLVAHVRPTFRLVVCSPVAARQQTSHRPVLVQAERVEAAAATAEAYPHQRAKINCDPQSTQKVVRCRRAVAC